ncbi:MAG: hypothetical protein AB2827_12700 [Candidatus Thiodiazotropha sp.]
MKVDIQHDRVKKGLLLKKEMHQVTVDVRYSEEEKAIFKEEPGLERVGLISMQLDFSDAKGTGPYVTPGHFLDNKPVVAALPTSARAKEFEAAVVDMLREVKGALDYNAAPAESSSFEL